MKILFSIVAVFILVSVTIAKEIVLVTDISVKPTKVGVGQIDSQLMQILDFNFQGNTYLKFEDKITMSYIDNSAENAAAYFPSAIFDLSEDQFDKNDNHLDNYYSMAGEYIDSMVTVPKNKDTISNEGKEIIICMDDSKSMTKLTSSLSNIIKVITTTQVNKKDKIGFISFSSDGKARISNMTQDKTRYSKFYDFRNSNVLKKTKNGAYLADGLNKAKNLFSRSKKEKIIYLITDGVDERKNEISAIKKLKDANIKIVPIAIGSEINMPFLEEISFNGKVANANNLSAKDISSIPKIPILESLHQIINNNFYSEDAKEKKLFILSTLLQNTENMTVFDKSFDQAKVAVIGFKNAMQAIGYESNLDGIDVQILMLPSNIKANKAKNIKSLFIDYLKALGAKSVNIRQGTFDLK